MLRSGLLIAVALLGLCGTASAAPRAMLAVTGQKPLTIAGRDFRARERVRVVLDSGRRTVRHVRATGGGTFSVTFRRPSGRCRGFSVIAVGNRGSRAMLPSMHPYCLVG